MSELTVNPNLARVKRLMKAHGVTQDRVAIAAGVDRTMVNKVVNGRAVSQRVLDAIADLLAVRAQAGRRAS